ncbi:MAG: AbrB family transcriptional regulator [Elusimicrobia bacterium GWA2_69_24]|nr:MAG: AbrB family transcriptional regulator [Elusimicrobia bacterium GWA2_69_24]HBL18864.1 AbrB family transcriptional regulator [Elusimicrobiota bacterium]
MVKFLTRVGNSEALVIDKAILSLLHISETTPLEITTDGKNLVISPISEPGQVKEALKAYRTVKKRFGRALKRLAD